MGIESAMARFIEATTATSSHGSPVVVATATATARAVVDGSRGSPGSRGHGEGKSPAGRNAVDVAERQATRRVAVRFQLIDGQGAGTQIADDYQDAVDALCMRYGTRLECIAPEGEC